MSVKATMRPSEIETAELDCTGVAREAERSGVSWAAIFAGAAAAAALSLILLTLGVGLGFAAVSPWSERGASGTTLGVASIVWLVLTQAAASGLAGYLAGRLRTKWADVHTDEVYFRDTAHGFLAWAVATLVMAGLLTSAAGNAIGTAATATGSIVSATASTARTAVQAASGAADDPADSRLDPLAYFSDRMLRSVRPDAPPLAAGELAAVGRTLAMGVRDGRLDGADRAYLAQVISARTGSTLAEAEQRVDEVFSRAQAAAKQAEATARESADKARKAAAQVSLWTFVALLSGAFLAGLAATAGGRRRDSEAIVVRARTAVA